MNQTHKGRSIRKQLSVWLVLSMLGMMLAGGVPVFAADQPSQWAVAEVDEARGYGLVPAAADRNYLGQITRVLFCEQVVNLVENSLGRTVPVTIANPFLDVNQEAVVKARQMGIVFGKTTTRFDPLALITRQEIAVMMMRAARYLDAESGTTYAEAAGTAALTFPDEADIANWALTDVRLANRLGIMLGQGGNRINPLGNTTVQESILLVLRLFKGFQAVANPGLYPTPAPTPTPSVSPSPTVSPDPTVSPSPDPTATPTPSPLIPIFTPTVTGVTISGGTAQYDTLSVTLIRYAGQVPANPTLQYQWQWADTAQGPFVAIAGGVSSSYNIPSSHIGKYLRCTVTGSGSAGGSAGSNVIGPIVSGFASGTGTGASPYRIATADQFMRLNKIPTDGKVFLLTADIELPAQTHIQYPFAGTLNGGGFRVTYSLTATQSYSGLFSRITQTGSVNTLHVAGSLNAAPYNFAGGITGYNLGTLSGCSSKVQVIGSQYVGGIAGYNDGTIRQCEGSIHVTGDRNVGGVAGINNRIVTRCHILQGAGIIGGLSASTGPLGGLVGQNRLNATISNSYAKCNVIGDTQTGGLVGFNSGSVLYCYSVGMVSGTEAVGGLIGGTGTGSSVLDSYYDTERSGLSDTDRGTPVSTAGMMTQATYASWDFTTIWGFTASNAVTPWLR